MFANMLKIFEGALHEEPEPVRNGIAMLKSVPIATLNRWVASFKPRHSDPKAGRAWAWELSISSLASVPFKESLDNLCAVDTEDFKIAPHRWGQTQLHKQCWDDAQAMAEQRGR
ncbi:unnamed protein product [Prorocentrum cordatum]|uniref:Uncharacterized protein n=1 Tax=Prorocentrum cordatum TaxID=2364126 RepID=A0ABN9T0X5_9DINO|nr:unnamed protein product [Polarella glacialis]